MLSISWDQEIEIEETEEFRLKQRHTGRQDRSRSINRMRGTKKAARRRQFDDGAAR